MYFIITILITISLFYVFKGKDFGFFTKDKTYLLKAVLPYMIFIHHSHFLDCDFYYVGAFVVSLFFFMSGYGMESKREQNAVTMADFPKSIKKLIIPLIIPIIIFLFIRLLSVPIDVVYNEDISKYQLILPYTWFVVTLILLYVFFYISATVSKKRKGKDVVFLCIVIAIVLCFNLFGKNIGVPSWARNTTTAFLAGILYHNYEKVLIKKLSANAKLYAIVLSLAIIVVTVYIKGDLPQFGGMLQRPILAFVWSSLIMLIYSILPVCKNAIILYLSSISYELYICQSIGFLLLGDKHELLALLYLPLSFIVCTIVAMLCHTITNKVFH